jgi:hypothetical protein
MNRFPLFFYFLLAASLLFTACDDKTQSPQKEVPTPVKKASPRFQLLPPARTGIQFSNNLPENEQLNIINYEYYYNGGGVGIGDFNGDGLADIFFTANLISNRLYYNRGNWQFEEAIKKSNAVSRPGWKSGVAVADVNGDGWLDLYICRSGNLPEAERRNELFINQGDGTFQEEAAEYGLDDPGYSTQAAFFDYDRDGDLDVYIANHGLDPDLNLSVSALRQQRHPYFGDKLYRNDQGQFTEVGAEAGILSPPFGFGLNVSIGDINQDDWPDIFVTNDFIEHDYLYINQGNGTFKEELKTHFAHTARFGMGSDLADYNNDLLPDLLVLDMLPEDNYGQKVMKGKDNYDRYLMTVEAGFYHQYMRNMFQLNLGQGRFSEVGQLAGISATDWSWSALMVDFDNDGWKDLHVTNGYMRVTNHMDFIIYDYPQLVAAAQQQGIKEYTGEIAKRIPTLHRSNYLYHNQKDLSFSDKTREWGLYRASYSNGAAVGDLDNDGDLDLVVNNFKEPAFLYQNQTQALDQSHFLRLRLRGEGQNTGGIGAKVWLKTGDNWQYQEMQPVRGYLSSIEPVLHFGLGTAAKVDSLKIRWPGGKSQRLAEIPADQVLALKESEASPDKKNSTFVSTLFAEGQIPGLQYRHEENAFVDFRRENLLPHMLSRMGPCLTVGDVNGDKLEDVFIGGRGNKARLFVQTANGRFQTRTLNNGPQMEEDTDAAFFDADGDGDLDLYRVVGGNEAEDGDARYQDQLWFNDGKGNFQHQAEALPAMFSSGGCVAASDIDGDGDQDLFVGGRVVPGRYPESPRSFLLRNEGGKFSEATAQLAPELATGGMISDALWTDVNGDGQADLLLAGEWQPIRVFINQNGKLSNQTQSSGLATTEGWWNRLLAADFDGDGDQDLVAGNLGLNTAIRASANEPASVYYKDFDNNGAIEPIVCSYIEGKNHPLVTRDELLLRLPELKKKLIRYETYGKATLHDVFSPAELADAGHLQATTFESSYLENQGNGQFVVRSLPLPAQSAPLFGLLAHDFNGDGHLDILAAGNFFPSRAETGRMDAGYGQLLLGNGKGDFEPMPLAKSGFYAPGDVRDLKMLQGSGGKYWVLVGRNEGFLSMLEWKSEGNM